ncbi:MAG: cupredoxin domain-containing protein [Parvibaculum sp.]
MKIKSIFAGALLLAAFSIAASASAEPMGMPGSPQSMHPMSGDQMGEMMGNTPMHDKLPDNIGKPGKAADADRTITIVMKDNFFEPEAITVKKGETVRFLIRNEGTLVHEFNIGTALMHEEHAPEMQMMVDHGAIMGDRLNHDAMKMDMGNGHTMKHDYPNTTLLEPGKTSEIIWTFSGDATLEFSCGVPGHAESGMVGTFTVE